MISRVQKTLLPLLLLPFAGVAQDQAGSSIDHNIADQPPGATGRPYRQADHACPAKRQPAEEAADLFAYLRSLEHHASGRWHNGSRQGTHQRRLARAVRPEEPDRPGRHLERETLERLHRAHVDRVDVGSFLAVDWALITEIIPKASSGRYMGISNVATASSGVLALILSGFLVINTISALMSQQVRQIGIMLSNLLD